jgi:2-dehydropantoate 2-reductase
MTAQAGANTMNILIAGLGALGTVHACLLKKAGHRVHALTKEKYREALAERRVSVTGIWGDHEAVLDGVHSTVEALRGSEFDLIILTVKSYDTEGTVLQLKPLVAGDCLIMVAQNGYGNYETAAAAVGREHTLLARVIFGVKLHAPGKAEVTVIADATRIGQPDDAVPPARIKAVADAINSAGIPAAYAENITAILWDKILYNCALNPLGAILECPYGTLAAIPGSRKLMDEIVREIFLTARGHGIPLNWKTAEDYLTHFYSRLVPPTAQHYPSLYYDMKAGKRLEIDALNGAIVRLAGEKGLAVPVNETVTSLIKAKESLSTAGPLAGNRNCAVMPARPKSGS